MVRLLVQGETRGLSTQDQSGPCWSWSFGVGSIGPALCRIFVVKGNLFAQFAHFIFPKCCFGAASPE